MFEYGFENVFAFLFNKITNIKTPTIKFPVLISFFTYISIAKEDDEIKNLINSTKTYCEENNLYVGLNYINFIIKLFYKLIPEIREYSLSCKQKNFDFWLERFTRILIIICDILPEDNKYIHPMLFFLQSIECWKYNSKNLYSCISNNLWLLDDEIGESYFSKLSKVVSNTTLCFQDIQNAYRYVSVVDAIASNLL